MSQLRHHFQEVFDPSKSELGSLFCVSISFHYSHILVLFFFFHFMATPVAYGNSQARYPILATAVPYEAGAATPGPLTFFTGPGIKPTLLQQPKPLRSDP